MADRTSLIEAELTIAPPRIARTTRDGLRQLVLSLAPLGAAVAAAIWMFHARAHPGWVEELFFWFALAAGLVLLRLIALWLNRIDLVERGLAVAGVVVHKQPGRNGDASYYAWYSVGRRHWGVGWRGDEQDAEVGDAVTVLHGAHRPAHAIVYRWAGYSARKPRI